MDTWYCFNIRFAYLVCLSKALKAMCFKKFILTYAIYVRYRCNQTPYKNSNNFIPCAVISPKLRCLVLYLPWGHPIKRGQVQSALVLNDKLISPAKPLKKYTLNQHWIYLEGCAYVFFTYLKMKISVFLCNLMSYCFFYWFLCQQKN